MDKSKPFGLIIPQKTKAIPSKRSVFESDSDSDSGSAIKKSRPTIPQSKGPSKKFVKEELCEDPSIYEYDNIYDDMKAKEVAKVAAPQANKPSRYIDSLLKTAGKRKRDYERRIGKKVQLEREKEGVEFRDKDAFVTASYKKKMQELEEEEERERREDYINELTDVTKQKDLGGFYRHFLKQTVGEEKVPVFGEKFVKQEVCEDEDTNNDSKKISKDDKEKTNNSKERSTYDKEKSADFEKASNDARKSERDLKERAKDAKNAFKNNSETSHNKSNDSGNEAECGEKSEVMKDTNSPINDDENIDKDSDIDDSSDEDDEPALNLNINENSKRKETHKRNFRKPKASSSESEEDLENTSETDLKNAHHKVSKEKDDKSTDSSSEGEDVESNNENSVNKENINTETEKIPPKTIKRNVYAKRTEGDAFVEAQMRYFQRMSLKNK